MAKRVQAPLGAVTGLELLVRFGWCLCGEMEGLARDWQTPGVRVPGAHKKNEPDGRINDMARSIDGIVAAHQRAADLRAAGRPVWAHRLEVVRDDAAPFEANRDSFAASLRGSSWMRASIREAGDELASELAALWDEIRGAETVDQFDALLDEIYDLADVERCWITFRRN